MSTDLEAHVVELVPEPRTSFVTSRLLVFMLFALVLCLSVTPWQQTSFGKGRVIAYAPIDRQQTIDAAVDGRISKWHVHEGTRVNVGDPIVDIADNDPDLMKRLVSEKEAVAARVEAIRARIRAIEVRIRAMQSSQKAAMLASDHRTRMGSDRFRAAERAVEAAKAGAKVAEANHERQKALFEQGLTSKRAVEVAEADEVKARTDRDRAEASLSAARGEVLALSADQIKVETDAFASISDAEAAKSTADADLASTRAELARMEVRLSRQETQHVKAPARGTILRVLGRQGGEMVKTGDALALFIPDTEDRAVEIWVDGNDANLIQAGRDVRLQFEGWPAVQFSGWPSASVGTFGGTVAFVDAAAEDGHGKVRVVIVPNAQNDWPAREYLRQGTRAGGFILLNRVRLGYELWRQWNGFPPDWTQGSGEKKKEAKP